MITRQLGYKNNNVLEGGLNYWFSIILNSQKPVSTRPDEEFAKYDFRKSAVQALGGGEIQQSSVSTITTAPKPAIIGLPKKKKAAGGC
jgi:sulfur-carrier protein adenylyltransferase/sulfurtransferase